MTTAPVSQTSVDAMRGDPAPGRYLDAILADMDRHIRPELTGDRARFLYEALRRVLVRFGSEWDGSPPLGETGLLPAVCGVGLAERLAQEGRRLDTRIAREDARIGHVDEPAAARRVPVEAVQAALRAAGWSEAVVESLTVVIGGRSKETLLVTASGMGDLPSHLVIRRDLQGGSLGTTVSDEYELLKALHMHGVVVPAPYHLSRTGDGIGTPFLLLQTMPGRVQGDMIHAPASAGALRETARALAAIHALPAEAMRPLVAHVGPPPSPERLAQQVEDLARQWSADAREPSAAMDAALAWLSERAPHVERRDAFVHGDFSFHNLLFDGDRLGAVLDWELAHIGHPAEDLGYVRDAVRRVMDWNAFMAAYTEAGGEPVDAEALNFYGLFGSIRLLTKMLKAREMIESRRTDDILKADTIAFWMPRILQRVSLIMREILGG